MKRLVLLLICFVFFGYLLVIFSSMNFLGIAKLPYLGKPLSQIRSFCGMGALFTNEASMYGFATSYKFYQNGDWESWQELEAPLFEEYIATGRLASLRHSRLDKNLSQRMNRIGIKDGVEKIKQSEELKVFASHLFYRHNHNETPDSLAVKYVRKYKFSERTQTLVAFKVKPWSSFNVFSTV